MCELIHVQMLAPLRLCLSVKDRALASLAMSSGMEPGTSGCAATAVSIHAETLGKPFLCLYFAATLLRYCDTGVGAAASASDSL
jgi:hypothetical protein